MRRPDLRRPGLRSGDLGLCKLDRSIVGTLAAILLSGVFRKGKMVGEIADRDRHRDSRGDHDNDDYGDADGPAADEEDAQ